MTGVATFCAVGSLPDPGLHIILPYHQSGWPLYKGLAAILEDEANTACGLSIDRARRFLAKLAADRSRARTPASL